MNANAEYELHGLNYEEFVAELDAAWGALQEDPGLQEQAKNAKLDLKKVLGKNRAALIPVEVNKAYFDPVTTAIIVSFVPVAAEVTKGLWKEILLPWIQERRGKKSIKPAKKNHNKHRT